jgi:hypothetical protein
MFRTELNVSETGYPPVPRERLWKNILSLAHKKGLILITRQGKLFRGLSTRTYHQVLSTGDSKKL